VSKAKLRLCWSQNQVPNMLADKENAAENSAQFDSSQQMMMMPQKAEKFTGITKIHKAKAPKATKSSAKEILELKERIQTLEQERDDALALVEQLRQSQVQQQSVELEMLKLQPRRIRLIQKLSADKDELLCSLDAQAKTVERLQETINILQKENHSTPVSV